MDKIDRINEFVFSSRAKLDVDLCLKYIFFTTLGTIGLVYIYKSLVAITLTVIFSIFCISYFLAMVINKKERVLPKSRIMVNSLFLFFLTIHMVCISFLIFSVSRKTCFLLLYLAGIVILGFIYIWIAIHKINTTRVKTIIGSQTVSVFTGVGVIAGICFAKGYLKPKYNLLSAKEELQFIGILLLIASLFTDTCFIGFLKVYYIKKFHLISSEANHKSM